MVLVQQAEVTWNMEFSWTILLSIHIICTILCMSELPEPEKDELMFKTKMLEHCPVFIKVLWSANILGKQKAILWQGGEMEDFFLSMY